MTGKQFYDWQFVGRLDDVIPHVRWLGNDVVWSLGRDGEAFLLRAAPLEETLQEKIQAWSDPQRLQGNRLKALADIMHLVELHPELWGNLPEELQTKIDRPY